MPTKYLTKFDTYYIPAPVSCPMTWVLCGFIKGTCLIFYISFHFDQEHSRLWSCLSRTYNCISISEIALTLATLVGKFCMLDWEQRKMENKIWSLIWKSYISCQRVQFINFSRSKKIYVVFAPLLIWKWPVDDSKNQALWDIKAFYERILAFMMIWHAIKEILI